MLLRIPDGASAQDILRAIDAWAETKSVYAKSEATQLWRLLTALRGPDSDAIDQDSNYAAKWELTARLRDLLCPELARRGGAAVHKEKVSGEHLEALRAFVEAHELDTQARHDWFDGVLANDPAPPGSVNPMPTWHYLEHVAMAVKVILATSRENTIHA